MKFQYVGASNVRIIGKYRWDKGNKFVQDVKEPELIENLLTYPDGSFVEVVDESKKKSKGSLASDKE